MNAPHSHFTPEAIDVVELAKTVGDRIPPLWPLENFVAVNPYQGLADLAPVEAGNVLASAVGARLSFDRKDYAEMLRDERLRHGDISQALAEMSDFLPNPITLDTVLKAVNETSIQIPEVPTVARLATELAGRDWCQVTQDQLSAWAAGYFDVGQAAWPSPWRDLPLFQAWKAETAEDRNLDILGLASLRRDLAHIPTDPKEAVEQALARLAVPENDREDYALSLLSVIGGWAGHYRYLGWSDALAGGPGSDMLPLLAVCLTWESMLLEHLAVQGLADQWRNRWFRHEMQGAVSETQTNLAIDLVLHRAFELSWRNEIVERLNTHTPPVADQTRADVQAAFCIDVRSEPLRRALESQNEKIETLGFAGFFGIAIDYLEAGREKAQIRGPVLITPPFSVEESHDRARLRQFRALYRKGYKAFAQGAVSCFGFVETVGPTYLGGLLTRSIARLRGQKPRPGGLRYNPSETGGIDLKTQIDTAEAIISSLGLRDRLAPIVMLAGHGSTSANNPYASGLDCGACGGHDGGVNARLATQILNDPDVRKGLAERGLQVPDDTYFLPALHDTCRDEVAFLDQEYAPSTHRQKLENLRGELVKAGLQVRLERSARHAGSDEADLIRRSQDWAEVRPEWGLAGCSAFIAAPRHRTRGLDLGGKTFLHGYVADQDPDRGLLNLIMTAPLIVASWINLQYFASSIDPVKYGSGNKTLHNVVGQIGVLEGAAGDLRSGLPWQSVHDGEALAHEPRRLTAIIEAPRDPMNKVIEGHDHLRDLLDNGWMHLLAMDESGKVSHRYAGNLQWVALEDTALTATA
ncbi:MAG: DUF2309 domain-containing protein [Pseudomonadota bacterium]